MEKQAWVKQLAMDGKVARYCDDPKRALDDLIDALGKYFPPQADIAERTHDDLHLQEANSLISQLGARHLTSKRYGNSEMN